MAFTGIPGTAALGGAVLVALLLAGCAATPPAPRPGQVAETAGTTERSGAGASAPQPAAAPRYHRPAQLF